MKKIVLSVRNGLIKVESLPKGVEVVINDFDIQEETDMEIDGKPVEQRIYKSE